MDLVWGKNHDWLSVPAVLVSGGEGRRSDSATLKPATISLGPANNFCVGILTPELRGDGGKGTRPNSRILGEKSRRLITPVLSLPCASCGVRQIIVSCVALFTATHGGVIGTAGDYQ